jgi:hypothetical protein
MVDDRYAWSSCGSTYCTSVVWCIILTLYRFVLEPICCVKYVKL